MYTAIVLVGILLATPLFVLAARRRSKALLALGLLLAASIPATLAALDLWGELLWFRSLGFEPRAWNELGYRAAASVLGAAASALVVWLLTWPLGSDRRLPRAAGAAAAALMGFSWGSATWQTLALYLGQAPAGVTDPILGNDVSFYLFTVPFLDAVQGLALIAAGLSLAASLAGNLRWNPAGEANPAAPREPELAPRAPHERRPVAVLWALAGVAVVVAAGQVLGRYHLLFDGGGVVSGPGWTDVHIRMPAYWLAAVAFLVTGVLPLLPPARAAFVADVPGTEEAEARRGATVLAGLWGAAILVTMLGSRAAPAIAQWLAVEPNEITYERPYIGHNIEFTRRAFDLGDTEVRSYPADPDLDASDLEENSRLVEEVRLWDYRALAEVYEQFQEIRLYYEFSDVDVDRYRLGDRYRQVMVSARELEVGNLPEQSQTFVNRRFVFTHGHGVAMSPVRDFTDQGLPEMLIQDLPPRSTHEDLVIDRPEIYYGERTIEPVVVNSTEQEFDYPKGDENVYVHYEGDGGVPLLGPWRRFLFGWKFDGTRLFMSDYPRPESRIMFRRTVRERVAAVAPFLAFDDDPYVVLADGRLKWILDGYTHSRRYPYSEPLPTPRGALLRGDPLAGANYMRNSVKAVVDAYDGSVDLYVFEPDDPVIRAWDRAFPGLFRDRDAMPPSLRAHVRYPAGLLRRQGLVYARYHMKDPVVFYNQEDLWVRATEKYDGRVQPVEPYYVMWEPLGSDVAEFVLMQPFTPKGRQVMVGWIAGRCDGENYGRLLAYKFPKDRKVLGPQQVETKIDQDRHLSGQLTLWDQRGSNVIRGNVLAIPLDETLLHVEPIYLQADTAAYPELRLVVAMQGDQMAYAPTLDEALKRLVKGGEPVAVAGAARALPELAQSAQEAFQRHLSRQAQGDFAASAEALAELQSTLQEMVEERPAATPAAP